jgi:hypothetical protein
VAATNSRNRGRGCRRRRGKSRPPPLFSSDLPTRRKDPGNPRWAAGPWCGLRVATPKSTWRRCAAIASGRQLFQEGGRWPKHPEGSPKARREEAPVLDKKLRPLQQEVPDLQTRQTRRRSGARKCRFRCRTLRGRCTECPCSRSRKENRPVGVSPFRAISLSDSEAGVRTCSNSGFLRLKSGLPSASTSRRCRGPDSRWSK